MASLRLTFLYPHLFRSLRVSEVGAHSTRQQCHRQTTVSSKRANFATMSRKRQRFVERHGKAVEPFLVPGETKEDIRLFVPESTSVISKDDTHASTVAEGADTEGKDSITALEEPISSAPLSEETQAAAWIPGDPEIGERDASPSNSEMAPKLTVFSTTEDSPQRNGPLEKILEVENPPEETEDSLNIPHLQPPPYVHNFDSYTLVKEVEKGGFTTEQAITSMKAVRMLLANNLEVAKKGLVSKSDVENQTYLFRAACSELRTEIENTRKASDEKMRRDRTLLQHEVDTLNQKLTQELLTLKDELQGMFNDRKMAVRMDQREMDSAIQQLNYKITVALNSDSKSEVEGLRWVLTRRSVLAIVFMAFMVLSSLRYASYRAHEDELEQKRQQKFREADAALRARQKDGEGMADSETQTTNEGDEGMEKRDLPPGTMAETLSAC